MNNRLLVEQHNRRQYTKRMDIPTFKKYKTCANYSKQRYKITRGKCNEAKIMDGDAEINLFCNLDKNFQTPKAKEILEEHSVDEFRELKKTLDLYNEIKGFEAEYCYHPRANYVETKYNFRCSRGRNGSIVCNILDRTGRNNAIKNNKYKYYLEQNIATYGKYIGQNESNTEGMITLLNTNLVPSNMSRRFGNKRKDVFDRIIFFPHEGNIKTLKKKELNELNKILHKYREYYTHLEYEPNGFTFLNLKYADGIRYGIKPIDGWIYWKNPEERERIDKELGEFLWAASFDSSPILLLITFLERLGMLYDNIGNGPFYAETFRREINFGQGVSQDMSSEYKRVKDYFDGVIRRFKEINSTKSSENISYTKPENILDFNISNIGKGVLLKHINYINEIICKKFRAGNCDYSDKEFEEKNCVRRDLGCMKTHMCGELSPEEQMLDITYGNIDVNNLPNNQKQSVFGYSHDTIKYRKCPKYFRSNVMRYGQNDPDLLEWSIHLNKYYTTCASANSNLLFPIRFILPEGKNMPHKHRLPEDNRYIFKRKFVGILRIEYLRDLHKSENLCSRYYNNRFGNYYDYMNVPVNYKYLFIFSEHGNLEHTQNRGRYDNWFNKDLTNYLIVDYMRNKILYGYVFPTKHITYDEFNMLIHYQNMSVYRHPDFPRILLLSRYRTKEELIKKISDERGSKGRVNKIERLEKVNYNVERSDIPIYCHTIDNLPKHTWKINNTIISQSGGSPLKLFNNNFVRYNRFIVDVDMMKKLDKLVFDEYHHNLFHATDSYREEYLFSIKLELYDRYGESMMHDKIDTSPLIFKIKNVNRYVYYALEILNKFKLLNGKLSILQLGGKTPFFIDAFNYNVKDKFNYDADWYCLNKYLYLSKNINLKKDIGRLYKYKISIFDGYIDKKFIIGEKKKYDMIFGALSNTIQEIDANVMENANKQLNFYSFLFSINHLNIGGNFLLTIKTLHTKATADIVLIAKQLFEKIHIYRSKFHNMFKYSGCYLVCINFKGVSKKLNNDLFKIFNDLYDYDSTGGHLFNIVDENIRSESTTGIKFRIQKPIKPGFKYKYINEFLPVPENDKQYEFIKEFNNNMYSEKIRFIRKLINLKKSPLNVQNYVFDKYKSIKQISMILWANEFNVELDEKYSNIPGDIFFKKDSVYIFKKIASENIHIDDIINIREAYNDNIDLYNEFTEILNKLTKLDYKHDHKDTLFTNYSLSKKTKLFSFINTKKYLKFLEKSMKEIKDDIVLRVELPFISHKEIHMTYCLYQSYDSIIFHKPNDIIDTPHFYIICRHFNKYNITEIKNEYPKKFIDQIVDFVGYMINESLIARERHIFNINNLKYLK